MRSFGILDSEAPEHVYCITQTFASRPWDVEFLLPLYSLIRLAIRLKK